MVIIRLCKIDHRICWGVFSVLKLFLVFFMLIAVLNKDWVLSDEWKGSTLTIVSSDTDWEGKSYSSLVQTYCQSGRKEEEYCELFTNLEIGGFLFLIFQVISMLGTTTLIVSHMINIVNFTLVSFPIASILCTLIAQVSALGMMFGVIGLDLSPDCSICPGSGSYMALVIAVLSFLFFIPSAVCICSVYKRSKSYIELQSDSEGMHTERGNGFSKSHEFLSVIRGIEAKSYTINSQEENI